MNDSYLHVTEQKGNGEGEQQDEDCAMFGSVHVDAGWCYSFCHSDVTIRVLMLNVRNGLLVQGLHK